MTGIHMPFPFLWIKSVGVMTIVWLFIRHIQPAWIEIELTHDDRSILMENKLIKLGQRKQASYSLVPSHPDLFQHTGSRRLGTRLG